MQPVIPAASDDMRHVNIQRCHLPPPSPSNGVKQADRGHRRQVNPLLPIVGPIKPRAQAERAKIEAQIADTVSCWEGATSNFTVTFHLMFSVWANVRH